VIYSVELDATDKDGCGIILKGDSSPNNLHLIVSSEPTKEQNIALAARWVEALSIIIENAHLQVD
jgi:hypothetical protein